MDNDIATKPPEIDSNVHMQRKAGRPRGSTTKKLVSSSSQTSESTLSVLSFTTAAGRKVVKAFQQLLKAYDGLEKQQAPKRQKEAKKFEASRKAELKRKTKDIKFLKKQLAEKRKTAKEKGHLNDHTRLYIQQVKARLQEAESAKRELSLLLQPLKETVLIPRQTCTDTAPQPTTSQSQPSTDQTGHAITGVNSSAAQLSTVTDTVVASASVGPQVEQLQQENELLKAAVSMIH